MSPRFADFATVVVVLCVMAATSPGARGQEPAWPEITRECRPWTYWWWMGSAVGAAELERHVNLYSSAGMGGMHIVPIYGAQGCEERYINYLTPQWMAMLDAVTAAADGAGMGIDMTTGTGWPFGGPWVDDENAAARVFVEPHELAAGESLAEPLRCGEQPEAALRAVVAFSADGAHADVTDRVTAEGQLDWFPDRGRWTVYAVYQGWTRQQVKRAAPGAEGNVMDYFSRGSLDRYLAPFDAAFNSYRGMPPRAFYNDSYEVYNANWTGDFFEQFTERRGYDLRAFLPQLVGLGEPDAVGRVRSDYCETVSDLLYERFTVPWVAWSHANGALTRNQAHGSPGNLLDLYAAADIPETEGFGRGGAEILMTQFASSAAHVCGKRLVSSESCTWLDEHFQVSLAEVKPAIDQLFLGGVNHVFFHGMAFSPADVPWPGWLFYASTNFGPSNTFWPHLPELNAYIARCQSFLQSGAPDNDVLLYQPIYDYWHLTDGEGVPLKQFSVHYTGDWLHKGMVHFYNAAKTMDELGFTFDYISDKLLIERTRVVNGQLDTGGGRYRALVLPACTRMPGTTLGTIVKLVEAGAAVIVVDRLPSETPGRAVRDGGMPLKAHLETIALAAGGNACGPGDFKEGRVIHLGKGRLVLTGALPEALAAQGIVRETMTDSGVGFVRRSHERGKTYFLANRSAETASLWLPLATACTSAVLFDPRLEQMGAGRVRTGADGRSEVRVDFEPGGTRVIQTFDNAAGCPPWPYLEPAGDPVHAHGPWTVTFLDGGPATPEGFGAQNPVLWTNRGDELADAFSGKARYETRFALPETDVADWILDLGEVHESAAVFVNGEPAGILWCKPYRLSIGHLLKPGENTLAIEVVNLMANRIRHMDRAGENWQNYFFVNIDYKPFSAAEWPVLPSGLAGPVTLAPQRAAS